MICIPMYVCVYYSVALSCVLVSFPIFFPSNTHFYAFGDFDPRERLVFAWCHKMCVEWYALS